MWSSVDFSGWRHPFSYGSFSSSRCNMYRLSKKHLIRYLTIDYLINYITMAFELNSWMDKYLTNSTYSTSSNHWLWIEFCTSSNWSSSRNCPWPPNVFIIISVILTVGSPLSYDYLQITVSFIIRIRTINGQNDHFHLQTDLDLIVKWTEIWQMNLNIW